ncbi:MAG: hypothetical protein ACRDHG_09665 [Anaerolineales bacterium]
MADVYAVFGTLIGLGIAYPGMLTAWWLIFPRIVSRASERLEHTPWRCLAIGGGLALPLGISIAILLAQPSGAIQFIGAALLFLFLASASLGASGLADLMGRRLTSKGGKGGSQLAGFIRGAVALELAAAFPGIGWFFVLPLGTVVAFGAAAFAVLGWTPARKTAPAIQPALGQALG